MSEILVPCDCGIHVGGIVYFADDQEYYFTYGTRYEGSYDGNGLWGRIKLACKVLMGGSAYFNEIVLKRDELEKVAAFMVEALGIQIPVENQSDQEDDSELVHAVANWEAEGGNPHPDDSHAE